MLTLYGTRVHTGGGTSARPRRQEPEGAAADGTLGGSYLPALIIGMRRPWWLVRAPTHEALAGWLAAVPRPGGRLRVEVDPQRI